MSTSVIPRPKQIVLMEGRCVLNRTSPLAAPGLNPDFVRRWNESFRAAFGWQLRLGLRPSGGVILKKVKRLSGVPSRDEGYVIRADKSGVTLTACTERGLWHAGQTLIGLARGSDLGAVIPCCEARDWPDFSFRGFMADPARKFIPLDRMKWIIDLLSRNKYNYFHVHFSDAQSFTLPTRSFPKLNSLRSQPYGVYSKAEIRELCRYANDRHVEIIPEIDMPGHATFLVSQIPGLACRVPGAETGAWTMCAGSEATYRFMDRLIGEIAPLFPGRLLHIGTDELEFRDMIHRIHASWYECPVCRRRMAREGLDGSRQLFYYFVRRMKKIAGRHGKRLMMWNDAVDIAHPPTVPRDALIHYWRVAYPGRGPHRGCSLTEFLRQGFRVVNSCQTETYLDTHIRDSRLVRWNPLTEPRVPTKYHNRVLGGESCAWYDTSELTSLPSFLALFADRLWNRAPIDDPDGFAHNLPRHIFGPQSPDSLNGLFAALGVMAFDRTIKATDKSGVLKKMTRARRLALCADLRKALRREVTRNRLMNVGMLRQYDQALAQVQRLLTTDLCPP